MNALKYCDALRTKNGVIVIGVNIFSKRNKIENTTFSDAFGFANPVSSTTKS